MLKCILFLNLLALFTVGNVSSGGGGLEIYRVKPLIELQPRVFTLSENDDGRKIHLRKNDILVLKLKARFGTGYSWQVAVNNDKRLKLTRQSVEQPDKNGESGGYETQIFNFQAKDAGSVGLELHYMRVWEKEVKPLKVFRLKLQISKS